MTTPHLPGKFIWFEHASGDIAKARAFYEPLFGWHVEAMPMGYQSYHMILNGGDGIGGLRATEPGQPTHWMSYLSVPDVDESFAVATKGGAKPVSPPTDYAPVGRGATIVDPITASDFAGRGVVARPFRPSIVYDIGILLPMRRPQSRLTRDFIADVEREIGAFIMPTSRSRDRT